MEDLKIWMWLLLMFLLIIAYWYLSGPRKLPPGSSGLPILGYLPFMNKEAHLTFSKLGKKYGNVFYLYLGSRLVVVLNDVDAIREAFVKQADIFAGRPADINFRENKEDNLGVVANDGEYWKQHRRFILTNLRDYGVGKLALEPLILTEIHHCLAEIRKANGKSFAIKQLLNNSLANNIHILVTGKRYDYDHPTMTALTKYFKELETVVPQLNLMMFFPWLFYVPGTEFLIRRKAVRNVMGKVLVTIGKILDQVKSEYKDGERENYVHAFMTEKNYRSQDDVTENAFTDLGLLHVTRDLLLAGTETSASTLHWGLLYMILHPDVQKKVQAQIDEVIGSEREPSYNDRGKMPYVEATIMEIHRIVSLAPLSLPHRNIRDTEILGHFIPKNTMIFPNLWAVHHDYKTWKDPYNFRPERFIGPDGQVIKSDHLLHFSIGKRACAGEPLARMELFLYFVSLLQNFDFVPPDGVKPILEAITGPARRPKFQNICAKARI